MKNKTLLILAAGMGSRFGGLKQTEPVGPNQEFIIDYSIFDAIRCGFNKVVFIIKEENYELFRNTIGKRVENQVETKYVFQNFDNVPKKYKIPENRIKPLGTAHAILCAKDVIDEPFVIINADDFYGYDAFRVVSNFIDNNDKDIGIVGYNVLHTLTENGSVKRGIIKEIDGYLFEINESSIENKNGIIEAIRLSDNKESIISENTLVSMNMISFQPNFFKYIEDNFDNFLKTSNLEKDEYLIPDVISKSIQEKKNRVKILETNATWVGVTYKEDKPFVVNYINELIKNGIYDKNLWKK